MLSNATRKFRQFNTQVVNRGFSIMYPAASGVSEVEVPQR